MGASLSKLNRASRARNSSTQGQIIHPTTPNNRPPRTPHALPPELWHLVLSHLYPSQLAQVAQVNRHFYLLVTSLRLWSAIYHKAFPSSEPLPLLPSMPPSVSYALFVTANSLQICEQCFGKSNIITTDDTSTDGITSRDHSHDDSTTAASSSSGSNNNNSNNRNNRSNSNSSDHSPTQDPMGTASWPLPVFLPWAKAMIRLCLVCRRKHFYCYPELMPRSMVGKRWRKKQIRSRFHLRNEEILQLKRFGCGLGGSTFCAEDALATARVIYGGDIGVAAVDQSPTKWTDRSISRVEFYHKRCEGH